MRNLLTTGALALCALPSAAGTWIVDDDGPADFATIQDAIDAAAPGDVILVLGGVYPGFVLDTAATVLGLPGVTVDGQALVAGVNDGSFAVLANLGVKDLDVSNCASTIVIDELTFTRGVDGYNEVSIQASQDVRIRKLLHDFGGFWLPLEVGAARVEVCDSELVAFDGNGCSWQCAINPTCVPGNATPALRLDGPGSVVHAYRTSIQGGDGGEMCMICCDGKASQAVAAKSGSEVLLAGQAEHGVAPGCWPVCANAVSLTGNSAARISGVSLYGNVSTTLGSSVHYPGEADPTLHILAQVGAGGNVTFRVIAPPGASVKLDLGRFPDLVPVAGLAEDVLVEVLRTFDLGPVDVNGVAGFNFKLPAFVTSGSTFFAQARVTLSDASTRYTNSVPVVVR